MSLSVWRILALVLIALLTAMVAREANHMPALAIGYGFAAIALLVLVINESDKPGARRK